MTTLLRFAQIFIWILYLSFLVTWFKTFVTGNYFEHAPIYMAVLLGLYPLWGGWLAFKISKLINAQIKLEKNN